MTAPPPGPRAEPSRPSRTSVLNLAAALLLAVSGLFALPVELFTTRYYTDSWMVAALVAPASTLTTLALAAAAVARGSRVFLLVVTVGTALHLVGLAGLALASGAEPELAGRFWSGPTELGLALIALALAWWAAARPGHHPWAPLLLLALAPLLGQYVSTAGLSGATWWAALAVSLDIPLTLTVLAAGLVCLPGRGAAIVGAALIPLAGVGLHVAGHVLGDAPQPYRLAVMGFALACAVAGIVVGARPGTAHPGAAPARTSVLLRAALVVLVLTVALDLPRMFAHGPGIRPGGAGLMSLVELLVTVAVPTAFTLTAGAVTFRTRGVLVTASVCTGILALALVVVRTAPGSAIALHDELAFVALGLSLALAWTAVLRPGARGTTLRWAAVVPLVLAAPPLRMLTDPNLTMHATSPAFLIQFVLPILLFGLGPVLAAALLGFPRHGARVAAATLLAALALGVLGAGLTEVSGPRLPAGLNLLRVAGYALAAVLVVVAITPPRTAAQVAGQRSVPLT